MHISRHFRREHIVLININEIGTSLHVNLDISLNVRYLDSVLIRGRIFPAARYSDQPWNPPMGARAKTPRGPDWTAVTKTISTTVQTA